MHCLDASSSREYMFQIHQTQREFEKSSVKPVKRTYSNFNETQILHQIFISTTQSEINLERENFIHMETLAEPFL